MIVIAPRHSRSAGYAGAARSAATPEKYRLLSSAHQADHVKRLFADRQSELVAVIDQSSPRRLGGSAARAPSGRSGRYVEITQRAIADKLSSAVVRAASTGSTHSRVAISVARAPRLSACRYAAAWNAQDDKRGGDPGGDQRKSTRDNRLVLVAGPGPWAFQPGQALRRRRSGSMPPGATEAPRWNSIHSRDRDRGHHRLVVIPPSPQHCASSRPGLDEAHPTLGGGSNAGSGSTPRGKYRRQRRQRRRWSRADPQPGGKAAAEVEWELVSSNGDSR